MQKGARKEARGYYLLTKMQKFSQSSFIVYKLLQATFRINSSRYRYEKLD